jgi:hypothetical protein
VTCMGYSGGPENDTNRWQPAHRQGKSYTVILEAIRAAVMAEREECRGLLRAYASMLGREGQPDMAFAVETALRAVPPLPPPHNGRTGPP